MPAVKAAAAAKSFMAFKLAATVMVTAYSLNKLGRNNKDKVDQPKVQLSERGSPAPIMLGRDELPPILVWAGETQIKKESLNGGGKGGAPKSERDIYYQKGIHVVATARKPRRLRRIRQNGEVIWTGDIRPDGVPSGTVIDLGAEGAFEIQWGLLDDPVDGFASSALGVASRFAGFTRINWVEKRLGQVLSWPTLLYEFEVEPFDPTGALSDYDPWVLDSSDGNDYDLLALPEATVVEADSTSILVRRKFPSPYGPEDEVDLVSSLTAGTLIQLDGLPNLADGTLVTVQSAEAAGSQNLGAAVGLTFADLDTAVEVARIFVTGLPVGYSEPATNATVTNGGPTAGTTYLVPIGGQMFARAETLESGANVGHVLSQLLFDQAPFGLGMDPSNWSLTSLVEVAKTAELENYFATITLSQGKTVSEAIGDILTDFGMALVQDSSSGLMTFKMFRPGAQTVVDIPEEALQGRPIAKTQTITPLRPRRVVFNYSAIENCYKNRTVELCDDGIVKYGGVVSDDSQAITTTRHRESAIAAANRREMLAFQDADTVTINVGYGGRRLGPGDFIRLPGEEEVLYIFRTILSDDEVSTRHEAANAAFAQQVSNFEPEDAGIGMGEVTDLSIPQYALWFPPAALQQTPQALEAMLLWTRGTGVEVQAVTSLSVAGLTYTTADSSTASVVGGVLTSDLSAVATSGVSFDIQGVDSDTVLNLEGTDTETQKQQLLVIGDFTDPSTVEVASVAGITLTTLTTADLGTLQRGLYSSTATLHPAGTQFFIVQDVAISTFTAPSFFQSGQEVFYKAQPLGAGATPPISTIAAQSTTP